MKKYVIKIAEVPYMNGRTNSAKLYKAVGFNSLVFDEEGLSRLEPLDDACNNCLDKGDADASYQNGLDDAWDAAKKLALTSYHGGYSFEELGACFGKEQSNYYKLFRDYKVEDIVEKIHEYEEKKKEDAKIKLWDEVEYGGSGYKCRFVVTRIKSKVNKIRYYGITTFNDGGTTEVGEPNYCDANIARKTGRHVDLSELFGGEKE